MSKKPEQNQSASDDGKVNMNCRIEPNRKAAYKAAAKKSRKTLSEWIRVHLDAAAESAGIRID
jgi:predicted HicB family RNase H-like nuclease